MCVNNNLLRKKVNSHFNVQNFLLAIFSLLIFQEIAFRIAFPIPEISNFDRSNYIPQAIAGAKYSHYRNSIWYWESSLDTSHKFVHKLNLYGFRDEEWEVDKSPEKKRVIFIGDSFLEGVMADQSETIVEEFKREDKKAEFDVMNLGIMGTGFNSYLKLITDVLPTFKPDLICLVIYSNDLSSEHAIIPSNSMIPKYNNPFKPRLLEYMSQYRKGNAILSRFNFKKNRFLPSIISESSPWYKREKALVENTVPEVRNSMMLGKMNPFIVDQILKERNGLLQEPNMDRAFEYLSQLSEKFNVQLVISYIPARQQITNHYYDYDKLSCTKNCPDSLDMTQPIYNKHQGYLEGLCSEHNFSFIDLTEYIRKKESREHLYWNYDSHMRGKGYKYIGKVLYKALDSISE